MKAVRLIWIADELRRVVAAALLPFLLVISFVTCAGIVSAQTPPFTVTAAVTPLGIQVTFTACQSSSDGNCVYPFSIYRSPQPGFNQSPIGYASLGSGGNSYTGVYNDQKFNKGVGYTYEVCSGSAALSDRSNCTKPTSPPVTVPNTPPPPPPPQASVTLNASPMQVQPGQSTTLKWTSTNATSLILEPGDITQLPLSGSMATNLSQTTTFTMYAFGPYGKPNASVTVAVVSPCQPFAPPQNLSHSPYSASFKWANPNTTPNKQYQRCPSSPTDVLIYQQDTGGYQQLADLSANNGVLPSHYTDWGPTQPHLTYWYAVCEGAMSGSSPSSNCAGAKILMWGANPVLTATRVNATTVSLQIAADQYSVSSISVTRVGRDDPCYQQAGAQGIKLGNGLQGCRTVTVTNGVPVPIHANPVTVYSWTSNPGVTPSWTFDSKSAPWVISIPDDTSVKPGVEYYYQAQVAWEGGPEQDSDTVTVPVFNPMLAVQRQSVTGLQPQKLSGGAPPPSQSAATARPMTAPMITPTTPMLQPEHPMIGSTGAVAAPPPAQSSTAARLTVQPMTAPPSRTTLPVRSAVPSPEAANLNAALQEVQLKPHDAQALYMLGKAYCASHLRDTGVSYMYMALRLAEQAGNAPLASQIKTSLAEQGVSAK